MGRSATFRPGELSLPESEEELEELLSRPDDGAIQALDAVPGDILVLGAGGKMGPTLARMARRAADAAGSERRVTAVSRFPGANGAALAERLRSHGVRTIAADLGDAAVVAALPEAPNLIFMAGQKFGTSAEPGATWAANAAIPSLVASRWSRSRIVAFSTGNVYPLVAVESGGARETSLVAPAGEYAWSCLARERIFGHYAQAGGSPLAIVRLNYAVEPRYGVLVDIAQAVAGGEPVDVTMGHVNVIWQGDASARAIECLRHAATPAFVVNVTGTETVRVRDVAIRLGELLGIAPRFTGTEAPDALLSNASLMAERMRPPAVGLDWLLRATAEWLRSGAPVLGKPTHFGERDGSF